MFKKYYLAYGSNLNLSQMCYRCNSAKPIGRTKLKNYRLVYKGRGDNCAYLTIEQHEGSVVPLGLYEVSDADINCLDIYEGYPTVYSKCYIPITIGKKVKNALIYVMNEQFDYYIPSSNYIKTCISGYNDFGFDSTILDTALQDTIANKEKKKVYKKD